MLKIEVFSHFHQIELLGVPDVVRNILELAKDCRSILSPIEEIYRVKDGQNRPKSTNFMNDPKKFQKIKNF
jgi:hypothetical protein